MACAVGARLINLGSAPYFFSDEAYAAETALGVLNTGTLTRWFFHYPVLNLGKPGFHYVLMAGAFKIFGVGVWQGRLVSALFGIGTALIVYLLARRLFGRRAGLIALAIYAFSRYAVYIDRSMKIDAQAAFFALLGLYLFVLAWEQGRLGLMAVAGTAIGLAVFSKPSSFFVPVAVPLYVTVVWARTKDHRRCLPTLAVLLLTAALPMALWTFYVMSAQHHPPYNVPVEEVLRGIKSPFAFGAELHVLGSPGLKRFISGALHLFANLLLRDEVRLLGLVGLLWLAVKRVRGWDLFMAIVLTGLVLFAFTRFQTPRHLHIAYIVLILTAAVVLAHLMQGKNEKARQVIVATAIVAMCFKTFCFETTVSGLDFKPIIEPDTPELRAMAWIRDNIPAGERLYCSSNIGVFSGHEYVPLQTLAGNPRAVKAFDLKYIVLDRYFCHGALMGYYEDPAACFELKKIHEVEGKKPTERVEIYKIVGPRRAGPPLQWYLNRSINYNFY